MLDYSALNKIVSQDIDVVLKLDLIYKFACTGLNKLSRFSVALIVDKVVSNYYVHDRLSEVGEHDYKEHELQETTSLGNVAFKSAIRVIEDLHQMNQTDRISELLRNGHRSSYTFPIAYRGETIGFIFINASQTGYFSQDDVARDCAYLSQAVAQLFIQLYQDQRYLRSALDIALNMGHARDPETKEHLTRMGMYSELIARILSENGADISHQFIHRIRQYAPLHDIGKYMIPDEILYSTRRFTPEERLVMNKHTIYGEKIIDEVITLSGTHLISEGETQLIKNIVRHHHEHFDGSGLPDALCNESIPLEARIVTLADVFDALLSRRAYKPAWDIDRVVEYVEQQTGKMFDPDCVDVLLNNLDLFIEIRRKYLDKVDANQYIAC